MSSTSASQFTAYFDMGGKLILQARSATPTLSVPMTVTRAPRGSKPALLALGLLLAVALFLGLVIAGLEYSYAVTPIRSDGPPTALHGVPVDYD